MAADDDAGITDAERELEADVALDELEADVVLAARLERDRSMVAHGRRIGGAPGAMMAGAMIAIRDIYEGPPKDEGSVVVDSPTEPEDVDRDGVALAADEVGGDHDLAVPAQPRRAPIVARRTSRRR